eukprot:CAMPEP_0119557628 /NCGR_PEP_ID=MMETSP1352-20130426/9245_1 /TAXON_ID=265584 /ORGANISM="Stauroneis constricta, Strain CCMP1120" /LENGTH=122 /DNA_ID=CAMNT_0007604765 /DNA_START=169 /DNA_END=537 /DNA_ORIENTATION=-
MALPEFVNTWNLESVTTEADGLLDTSMKDFVFTIVESDEDDHLGISFKIGNSMSSRIEVLSTEGNSATVKFSIIRSTRMMPPPELRGVENFFSKNLPQMTTMTVEGDTLTIAGSGEVVLKKE